MATTTYNTSEKRKVVITNQEVTTRKWKFETIFKVIAGIIYGFFFGLIPASFQFNKTISEPTSIEIYEICTLVGLLAAGLVSMALIFWAFKGDIKKQNPFIYSLVHTINAILLSVGILVSTILYPNSDTVDRYFIFATTYAAWAILMAIVILTTLAIFRRRFPLTWSKAILTCLSFLFLGVTQVFAFLAARAQIVDGMKDQTTIFLIIAFASILLSVIVFGFAIAFIKRYRDVLLGERTENEIDGIRDWESARISAIIIAAATAITYVVSLIMNLSLVNSTFTFSIPLAIEIVVDSLLIIAYVVAISVIKVQNLKNSNKSFYVSKIFKPIDNGLLLDILGWIILVKATLLQGIYLNNSELNTVLDKSILLLIAFGSLAILYAFNLIISVNIPNLRNTAVSIPTIAFAIVLAFFTLFFGGYLNKTSAPTVSGYIFIFLPLILLCGMSISTIIKICIVAKIFKVNWKKPEIIDNTYLAKEQAEQQSENLIGEKTQEIDPNQMREAAEKMNSSLEELRTSVNEGNK